MANSRPLLRANGFSLVEMMVALVFTLVLMAGMASVFKASLATFYTSGEVLSSARRNRLSMDQLGTDLNNACMYLVDPNDDPAISATNPSFYVLPNMPITGAPTHPAAGQPATADQLFFYMDQPLPFEGTIQSAPLTTAANLVVSGVAPTASNFTFTINCGSNTYANQVVSAYSYAVSNSLPAPWFVLKDFFEAETITAAPTLAGATNNEVIVVAGASPTSSITGIGPSGLPSNNSHLQGAGVLFVQPAQMVRYSVQYLQLDPTSSVGVPCLVRDQGNYSTAGFVANQPQQIITENIGVGTDANSTTFKVYLSANAGQSWAGLNLPAATNGFTSGWTNGLLTTTATSLTSQLATEVSAGWTTPSGVQATSLASNPDWFRYIPTLVRVDITTRTATQRTEYTSVANTAAYKMLTQSLVFVPRHSGLTLN
jgi:hypothetical protein